MFQSCPLPMTLMESRTATLEMEMGWTGGLSICCGGLQLAEEIAIGRLSAIASHELRKNHKHMLSILIYYNM